MKRGTLLFITLISALALNAQVFTEYFEDATNGQLLEEYNNWYVCNKAVEAYGETPVIKDYSPFYEGYAGSEKGKVAVIDSLIGQDKTTQRISTKVVTLANDTLRPAYGETMYAAFLVTIFPNSYDSWRDLFTWEGSSTTNQSRGRVFAKLVNDGADLQFAVSKNSSGDLAEGEIMEGALEYEHLIVLAYECVEDLDDDPNGGKNDVIKLYINPDMTKPASEQTNVLTNIDINTDYKTSTEMRINIRQRGHGAYIGGIRVGTNWDEVLNGSSTPVNEVNSDISTGIYAFQKNIVTPTAGNVEVFDLSGKRVLSKVTEGTLQTSLNNGIYLVRFKDLNQNFSSEKIVIAN